MRNIVLPLLTVAAFSLPTAPAQAQAPRTFVSAAGNDSNPCSFAAPCRHFQAAVTATSAGGEVDALDPAGYGPIVIGQAITIEGQGWSYIAPPASGAAIAINATGATDKISIRGVSLNGVGISNTQGILFNSGGTLTVQNSVIRNFSGTGIFFAPSGLVSNLFVSNTVVADNGNDGISVFPTGNLAGITLQALFNRVEVNNNGNNGIGINMSRGVSTFNFLSVTVSESVAAGNLGIGFNATTVGGGPSHIEFTLFNCVAANNGTGIEADGGVDLYVAHSMMDANFLAWKVGLGGTIHSFGDNDADSPGSGSVTPIGKF